LKSHDQRKKRLRREWLLTTGVAIFFLTLLVFADIARPLANVLYDHFMRLQGFQATDNIVIVSIDDHTIEEMGGWPLQRRAYSKLFEQLDNDCCRPKAVGIDLLFFDSTPDDAQLAQNMKRHNSVLPLAFRFEDDLEKPLSAQHPVAALKEAASLAHINLSFDTDGVIRGVKTYEQGWPHFALALHTKSDKSPLTLTQDNGYRRFRMVDPKVGFPMISLADALHSSASRSIFKDKYVLIGVTAPSLGDRYPTLYSGKNNASTPGVAILASVLNASLNEALIKEAPTWIIFLSTLLPLLLMLKSLVSLMPRHALMLAIFLVLSSMLVSYNLLAYSDYWIDPTPFILVAILLQPLWAWRRLEAIVHLVQDKTADLHQFQSIERARSSASRSREIVLQQANLLDLAIDSAKSELDFLAAIIDEMPDAVLIFDMQDQLLLCNKKYNSLFAKHPLASLTDLNKLSNYFNLPIGNSHELDPSAGPIKAKQTFDLDTDLGSRDFVLKTKQLPSPLGGDIRLIILIDITELKQSQAQRDRALQFLSHDMRTPIASILSITNTDANGDETRKKITHHARLLLSMMDDFILTVSAEDNHYKIQPVLLDNLINDALETVFDIAATKNIRISEHTHDSSIFVNVNTRLMVRVIVNLLFNAIKFSPVQSTINITTSSPSGKASVSPTAVIEISNVVLEQANDSPATSSMVGFGLGLDFVDTVLQKHCGTIHRDIPHNGIATITITLPCELEENLL
jgi:CHASE2 domain-containing sensor protein/nitrogen-specific signal transduction histidine kinase